MCANAGFASFTFVHFDRDFFDFELGIFQNFKIRDWLRVFLWIIIGEFGDNFGIGGTEARGRVVNTFFGKYFDGI